MSKYFILFMLFFSAVISASNLEVSFEGETFDAGLSRFIVTEEVDDDKIKVIVVIELMKSSEKSSFLRMSVFSDETKIESKNYFVRKGKRTIIADFKTSKENKVTRIVVKEKERAKGQSGKEQSHLPEPPASPQGDPASGGQAPRDPDHLPGSPTPPSADKL